jgi:nitrous oxidase accessory protein NosD
VLAVTWPAVAPAHDLGAPPFGGDWDASAIYVNQYGDARIDSLVIGPAGERLTGAVYWDDAGAATATTTGPLETEMAWYGPISGRVSDAGPGAASINQFVEANDRYTISIAGRDDVDVGQVGLAIDGPSYIGTQTIGLEGGYNEAYGSVSGEIFGRFDYVFYRFTAPWTKVWNISLNNRGVDPTMVIFDADGNPIGGSFLTAIGWETLWSRELQFGEEIFIRVDGKGAATGRYDLSVYDAEIVPAQWVTTVADSGPGSLRWAIESANIWPDHSTIWIDPQDGDTLNLLSELPDIAWDVTFKFAPGVTSFTIDAELARDYDGNQDGWGVFHVFGSINTAAAPMTIRNFNHNAINLGGSASTPRYRNSVIEGLTLITDWEAADSNLAPWAGSGFPCGIYVAQGGAVIRNNVIAGPLVGIVSVAPEVRIDANQISDCMTGILAANASITSNLVAGNVTGLATAGVAGSGFILSIGGPGVGNVFADNVQSGVYLNFVAGGGNNWQGYGRLGLFGNTFLRNNVGVTFDNAKGALVGGTPPSQGNTITSAGNVVLGPQVTQAINAGVFLPPSIYRAGLYGLGDVTGSMALNTTIETPFLGINLAQAQGLTIANTIVRNHSGLGLVAQGQVGIPDTAAGLAGTVIRGLTVERIGGLPTIDTAGAVLIDATGMRIESSNFRGDTTGIFVFNDAAGLVIVDNVFTGRATGVGLFQAKNLAFGQLGRGNTVQNAPGAGIYTGGNLAGTSLVANTITGNAVGIVLDNTTNLAIGGPTDSHGNAITGTGNSTGIWARLACSGTSIKKTRFSAHAADASLASATGIDFQP